MAKTTQLQPRLYSMQEEPASKLNLPELPSGWIWTTLDDIGQIYSGGTPSTTKPEYFDGDIPWITPADLPGYADIWIRRGRRNISEKGLASSSATLVPAGSVLFSSRAPIGYVAIAANEITTNQGFKTISPDANVNNQFLYYYLKSIKDLAEAAASGTTFLEISKSRFSKLPFPLPPLPEQERIVARIEELFSQLDTAEAALKRARANLKRYRQSLLQAAYEGRLVPQDPSDEPAEILLRRLGKKPLDGDDLAPLPEGWCWSKMGDIAGINGRDADIRNLPNDMLVTFVPMAAVDANNGVIARPEIRPLGEVRKGFTSFAEGDIIFAKITPCMENGKTAIATGLVNGKGFGSTEFHVLRPKEIIVDRWLYQLIRKESFRREAKNNFKGTAGQLRVPSNFFENYLIPLPPRPEQERIANEIDKRFSIINEVELILEAGLKRAARLRQAILKQAFEGKLVGQISASESAIEKTRRLI